MVGNKLINIMKTKFNIENKNVTYSFRNADGNFFDGQKNEKKNFS